MRYLVSLQPRLADYPQDEISVSEEKLEEEWMGCEKKRGRNMEEGREGNFNYDVRQKDLCKSLH